MIPIEELRELQAEFEPARHEAQSRYKEMEKLRLEFVRRFPSERISRLTLDEYVQGQGNKNSFCYWLEWKTAELGHIQGTPAIKFGIYYSQKKGAFQYTRKFDTAENAHIHLLTEITQLLEAADVGDMGTVRDSALSPLFKGKILFLYFPKRFINIFSERHVDHYLSRFRLNDPGTKLDLISKRERLTEFKNSDEVMKDWTSFEFSDFLYWTGLPPSRGAKVPTALKDYIPNFPAPEDTTPDFIDFEIGETPELPETTSSGGGKTDFDKKNQRNKLIGNQGEDIVLLAEKRYLQENGRVDLIKYVRPVCREDDGAGYDILSFELDGQEKQIEVKSTTRIPPATGSRFDFFISANEYEQAHKFSNYYLYVVFDAKSTKPKIWRIKNPTHLEPKRLVLKPSAYHATLTIA